MTDRAKCAHLVPGALALIWSATAAAGSLLQASPPPSRPSLYGQVARELLSTPEDKLKIGDAALRLSTLIMVGERYEREQTLLDDLAGQVARAITLKGRDDPEFRIQAVSSVLHRNGFHYSFDDMEGTNTENSLLLSMLRTKKGNCIAMPTLWYAVAERLGFPVFAVKAPQHIFLRYDDGQYRANIETTSFGSPSDERIISDLEIPEAALKSGAFMRSLSKREFLAVLIGNVAEKLIYTGNPGITIELFQDVRTVLPDDIASHWNLALSYSERAFMRFARREAMSRTGKANQEVPEEARLAVQHAIAATKLGAPKPLEKEYWKRVSRFGEKDSGTLKRAFEPFDVTSLIMRDNSRVQVKWQWQVDPVLYDAAIHDLNSCAHFCATFCGPEPGNFCAEDLRRRGLRR